ncbi:MAG: hypothetical protein ACFFKA_11110, partial [Candidatus Thorarchaeota archaeon]
QIEGTILRAKFELKYPIMISNKISLSNRYAIYAGEHFIFDHFEIYNPRHILNCINSNCSFNFDCLLLIKTNNSTFKLILPKIIDTECADPEHIKKIIYDCSQLKNLKAAINNNQIKIELINDEPINFLAMRSDMLEYVRNGKMPKGILKKWPLYVLLQNEGK